MRKIKNMTAPKLESSTRARLRRIGGTLFGAAVSAAIAVSALAADTVTLRVGDQKGGNRSLMEISGYAKDLPYKIEWSEFPAAAPILEALNAGALDVSYTGDLSFLTVYAAGAPIKAIGGTRSDARTQAILVRQDSPIKSIADLKGKRLAGTRGGWGQFLIDATLEKAGYKIEDATFAPLGPVDAKIALVAGSIDAWAVWEPYVSYATLKDNARVVANGEGLTPTVTLHPTAPSPPSAPPCRTSCSGSTRPGCGRSIICPNMRRTPPNSRNFRRTCCSAPTRRNARARLRSMKAL